MKHLLRQIRNKKQSPRTDSIIMSVIIRYESLLHKKQTWVMIE